jgi:hypothetical protein
MALTPTTGATYDLQIVGGRRARGGDIQGELKIAHFEYTAETAGQGTALVGVLPAGPIRILNNLSGVSQPTAANSGETIGVGYGEHYNAANTLVSASNSYFLAAAATPTVDPSGGAGPTPFNLPDEGFSEFDTRDGLPINITVATGDIAIGEIVYVDVAYVKLGSD